MVRAGVLARQSLDRGKAGVNVGIQDAEGQAYIAEQGWEYVGSYQDTDISASRFTSRDKRAKQRKSYSRLIVDLEVGRLDIVVLTELTRLSRDIEDVPQLLRIAEERPYSLVTTDGETYNLGTSAGVHRFLGAIADGQYESHKISERTRRKKRTRAAQGVWQGGPRPFGYQVTGTPLEVDGKMVLRNCQLVVDPAEAALIREAAAQILAGGTPSGVTRAWNLAGVTRPRGMLWKSNRVRDLLTSPRIAGLRALHDGTLVKAAWPGILDRQVWEQVQAVLAARPRRSGPAEPRVSLLAGLVHCAACAASGSEVPTGMRAATHNAGERGYWHHPDQGGCNFRMQAVGRRSPGLDTLVRDMVLTALADPDLRGALEAAARREDQSARVEELLAERAGRQARLRQLRDRLADDDTFDPDDFAHAKARIEGRVAEITRQLGELSGNRMLLLADLPTEYEELQRAWTAWDLDQRRTVLKAALRRVWVDRPGKGVRVRLSHIHPDWRV